MRLSTRVHGLVESATLAISQRARELSAEGVDVVNWSAGEPDFASPAEAVEAARRALAEGKTRYAACAGLPELRQVLTRDLARRYQAPWSADELVVTVGGKAALFETALALCDAEAEAVIPTPCWVTFPEQVKLAGGKVVEVPLEFSSGFQLAAADVIGRCTSRTRMVLLNSPSNPTGSVLSAGELRAIVEHCAEREIFVVCDETYERFVYGTEPFTSGAALAREFPETIVLIGSFSKAHAMTGWRLGFVAGPEPVVRAVKTIQGHATSNATTFAMWGALEVFADAETRLAAMRSQYLRRRDVLVAGLNELPGVECRVPDGAFYAFPRVAGLFDEEVIGSAALATKFLERSAVAVIPGIAFGADDHIRISFACALARIEEGLERLRVLLRSGG